MTHEQLEDLALKAFEWPKIITPAGASYPHGFRKFFKAFKKGFEAAIKEYNLKTMPELIEDAIKEVKLKPLSATCDCEGEQEYTTEGVSRWCNTCGKRIPPPSIEEPKQGTEFWRTFPEP